MKMFDLLMEGKSITLSGNEVTDIKVALSSISKDDTGDLFLYFISGVLEKKGYEVLGHGAEAVVIRHPNSDHVIKIFPSNSAFLKFVKLCKSIHDKHGYQILVVWQI
jgi:hypothetical protein